MLVDLLGLERLTNAFGLLLLFQGAAAVIGPPIAGMLIVTWRTSPQMILFSGKMYDLRGSYDDAFYLMGALVAMSGLMLFSLPFIQKKHSVDDDLLDAKEIDENMKKNGSVDYLPVPQTNGANC